VFGESSVRDALVSANLSRGADLLDHREPSVSVHNSLDAGENVVWSNDERARVRAYRFVFG
jgi:hypothetical protein